VVHASRRQSAIRFSSNPHLHEYMEQLTDNLISKAGKELDFSDNYQVSM
jgi:hypothetical protein